MIDSNEQREYPMRVWSDLFEKYIFENRFFLLDFYLATRYYIFSGKENDGEAGE